MQDWWKANGPPVYMAVAAYLGLIKDTSKEYGDLGELFDMFPGGNIS